MEVYGGIWRYIEIFRGVYCIVRYCIVLCIDKSIIYGASQRGSQKEALPVHFCYRKKMRDIHV